MKKNRFVPTKAGGGAAPGLWSMLALFAVVCGVALVLNITASQGNSTFVPMAPGVSSPQSLSIGTAMRESNSTNNNANCLTVGKPNEIFGIRLFNPFAWAENKTCPNRFVSADAPVAYPPTPPAQFERTVQTIKREHPAT